jgi:hypothetical protein
MPDSASQKLIRCFLSSPGGSETVRFVEFELFKLWQYMMTTKHGFQISDMTLCLWVNEQQFQEKESLYSRSGEIQDVSRIVVSIYDKENGFTHVTNRYVPVEETDRMRGVLLTHAPTDLVNSNQFEIETFSGKIIEKNKVSGLSEISLGLSND